MAARELVISGIYERRERWTTKIPRGVRDPLFGAKPTVIEEEDHDRRRNAVESRIFGSDRHHSSRGMQRERRIYIATRCGGAILTAAANLVCVPLSTAPRQMTWHWKIARNRIARRQTDGFVDSACLSGKRSRRAAPRRSALLRAESLSERSRARRSWWMVPLAKVRARHARRYL